VDGEHLKIVGIGASAGGFEALEEFFEYLPKNTGFGFVVVQHLDPTNTDFMSRLLQKVTTMPVAQITRKTRVKANHVYVIPPNKDLLIVGGKLNLKAPTKSDGLRLPIDRFFKSLATDFKTNAVGIVLSGMGSDGSLGLQAIKECGGVTLAQSPALAKFDSMPLSAINAGYVDIVESAKTLAENIVEYAKISNYALTIKLPSSSLAGSVQALDTIFELLKKITGNDFSRYKQSTIYRRLQRRLSLHNIPSIELYAKYLTKNPQEVEFLYNEMLIGVTQFFRDDKLWEHLSDYALPDLLMTYPEGRKFRAWIIACSTGEEAYSLAIAFQDCIAALGCETKYSLQIFATDLNDAAINIAREGKYQKQIEKDVDQARLNKYFIKEEYGYRISKKIREMVTFAPQNVIADPPFTKLDILGCRNLLIYFNSELQEKLIPLFHYALNPNGLLFLGSAETVGDFSKLFGTCKYDANIYKRLELTSKHPKIEYPTRAPTTIKNITMKTNMNNKEVNLQTLANEALLHNFIPAAVLINSDGDILYINGRIGKYLEPAAGRANLNIYAMAREGLRYEIDIAIKKALEQKNAVSLDAVLDEDDGNKQTVHLNVKAIEKPEALAGTLMVTFEDISTHEKISQLTGTKKEKALTEELYQAKEQIKSMRDEMKTSKEDLKAANEELQSTNEEIQSSNEELTTSKEEMESINEELHTLNNELQAKVDDLTCVNNDMNNLLNSSEIISVFLDNDLNVRRFTPSSEQLFKLIPSDIGRPLTDIVTSLEYEALPQDAHEVLRTLIFHETEVKSSTGKWYKMRMTPYRTRDNRIDGVVITFNDITALKRLERKLEGPGSDNEKAADDQ
jgi:chemotaxis protein methyltransferase CheR/two-component system CheB/CheR fusion protein